MMNTACIRRILQSFLVVFLLNSCTLLLAQQDSLVLHYARPGYPYLKEMVNTRIQDTLLDNLHNYFPLNLCGNTGLASYPLILQPNTAPLGIRYYTYPFQHDLFTTQQPVYYFGNPLYTNIFASAGQVKEQCLKLCHAQKLKNNINLALKFNRYSATGFYVKQLGYTNNLLFSSSYTTKKSPWGYFSHLIFNKLKLQENGGISSDSLIQELPFINKQLINVRLNSAKRIFTNFDISLTQYLRLNKSDSTSRFHHFLYHTFRYQNEIYQYTDNNPKSGFYTNIYIDSTITNDSIHLNKYMNEGRYQLRHRNELFTLYAGYRYDISELNSKKWKSWYFSHIVLAGGNWKSKNDATQSGFESEYILRGANEKDYRASIWFRQYFSFKHSSIGLCTSIEKRSPDRLYLWNEGNHFYWNNVFQQSESRQATFTFFMQDWKLKFEAYFNNMHNAIYFNQMAMPAQYAKSLNSSRYSLSKDMGLFRNHLHINNTLNYQLVSDTTFLRLPALYTVHQLYYQGNHYKNNLQVQLGFECTYISTFQSNAYMPATGVFYIQSETSGGNYPFIDFFMNARIKPVRFFIKIAHINQGFSGTQYSLVPGYYQPDRAIKFGLNWLFWD